MRGKIEMDWGEGKKEGGKGFSSRDFGQCWSIYMRIVLESTWQEGIGGVIIFLGKKSQTGFF